MALISKNYVINKYEDIKQQYNEPRAFYFKDNPGVSGAVMKFDTVSMLNTAAFTYSFWMKKSIDIVTGAGNAIDFSQREIYVYGSPDGVGTSNRFSIKVKYDGTDGSWYTNNDAFSSDTWHHVVLSYSGTTPVLYVDASSVTLNASTTPVGTIEAPTKGAIGSNWAGTEAFEGLLDEITIWNTNLSATRVTELYNGGKPSDPFKHNSSANLVAWVRGSDFYADVQQERNDAGTNNQIRFLSNTVTDPDDRTMTAPNLKDKIQKVTDLVYDNNLIGKPSPVINRLTVKGPMNLRGRNKKNPYKVTLG